MPVLPMPLAAKRRHRWDAEQRELWTARQKRTEVEWLGKKRVEGDGRELSERKRTVASVRLSELGLRFFYLYIVSNGCNVSKIIQGQRIIGPQSVNPISMSCLARHCGLKCQPKHDITTGLCLALALCELGWTMLELYFLVSRSDRSIVLVPDGMYRGGGRPVD